MPENSKKMTNLRQVSRPLVVVLAYDGLCTFEFGVAVEIFGLPRPELGDEWYRFAVASVDSGELRATGGIRIVTDGDLSLLASADLIVVPGWRGLDSPVPDALCEALRQASARGCRLLSICSGVFVLAATGLLNGRKATTHWRYIDALKARYPDIDVVEDVLYQDEGDILTSAGSAAGIHFRMDRIDQGLFAHGVDDARCPQDGQAAEADPAPDAGGLAEDLADLLHGPPGAVLGGAAGQLHADDGVALVFLGQEALGQAHEAVGRDHDEPGVLMAELDLPAALSARAAIPVLQNARPFVGP